MTTVMTRGRRDQVIARMREIGDAMDAIAKYDKPTRSQAVKFQQLETEATSLRLELEAGDVARQEQLAQVRQAAQGVNGFRTEAGSPPASEDPYLPSTTARRSPQNPWSPERLLSTESRSELPARGLTAIEQASFMPDAARERATRAIEEDRDPESRLARY